MGQYRQPVGQYGPPPVPHAGPGSPFGKKPPRETGALVVCLVLLLVALIGSFLASAAVYGNLTDDSSASGQTVPGTYAAGGAGSGSTSTGGTSTGGSSSGGGSADVPGSDVGTIRRNFPVYPGARKVASAKKYLQPGGVYNTSAINYVSGASAATLYGWYRKHLPEDHLKLVAPAVDHDFEHHKRISSVFASVQDAGDSVYGEFDIEEGIHGTTVIVVTLNG